MRAAELDLDLDVFAGPFDLLMAVVLREEISLAEVSLGEIVVAYLEHLETTGELDLDSATEFLVLIASLLELKSRLLLPTPRTRSEIELGPEEAADELLARMLEYRRYREAAAHLSGLFADGRRYLYRAAPLPPELRRASLEAATPGLRADAGSARRSATCCASRRSRTRATSGRPSRSSAGSRCFASCSRAAAASTSTRCSRDEDRLTQAVTLFALLEMHKRGEATWTQKDLFGPIEVEVAMTDTRAHVVEALLFLSPRAGVDRRAGRGLRGRRGGGRSGARRARGPARRGLARSRAARRSRAATRWPPTRSPRTRRAACCRSRARRRSPRPRPRRSRSSPTCSRSRGRRSPASAASPPSRRSATLTERGLIEESGRSRFGAVVYRTTPLFEKLFGLSGLDQLPDPSRFDPTPEDERELRERLLRPASSGRAERLPARRHAPRQVPGPLRGRLAAARRGADRAPAG